MRKWTKESEGLICKENRLLDRYVVYMLKWLIINDDVINRISCVFVS